ncbi:OmpA family protein [Opitutus terrae]|uniref:OmpA/MotB domain protein n=1 Tax=Opitutus terrae (strain DSM 11246 / JCM 15787 / PB90-1) TaxID=452637 RepID=B1ZN13_OPITP|nr:OmpA family protein [Opitutus terrae]ACB76465.1 OmpA/MotB domain protein [Opitutus terrae PB90-1]
MNISLKKLCVLAVGAAVLFAGCSKKPKRPDPSATVLGPTAGGTVNPLDVNAPVDASAAGLEQRDPNIIEDANSIRGMFEPVYFDFDKSDIKQAERAKLQKAADYMKQHPEQRILLEGHCDWRGTAEYNLGLGDRRANAAKRYLSSLAPAERIETLSKGSLDAAQNGDDAAMAKDRRVDIVILKAPGAAGAALAQPGM